MEETPKAEQSEGSTPTSRCWKAVSEMKEEYKYPKLKKPPGESRE